MRFSFHRVLPRRLKPQANTNVFKTPSAASGSRQILVSTVIYARNAHNTIDESQSKQILGKMPDFPTKALVDD
jgi:hypothetical protein